MSVLISGCFFYLLRVFFLVGIIRRFDVSLLWIPRYKVQLSFGQNKGSKRNGRTMGNGYIIS